MQRSRHRRHSIGFVATAVLLIAASICAPGSGSGERTSSHEWQLFGYEDYESPWSGLATQYDSPVRPMGRLYFDDWGGYLLADRPLWDLKHVIDGLPGTDYVAFCIPRRVAKSYNIDIEGEVYPDKMKLRFVRPAAIDFKEAKYRFCIVLFSMFQMVPTADFPEVNVPGAEWFFTRATNTAGDEVWFEVPLSAEGDRSTAHFEFRREMDYLKELEFKAYLNLDFKACSPPCE